MNSLNLEIEAIASCYDGDYIRAIIEYQEDHPEMDFYEIKESLHPIVLNKVKMTFYQKGFFPDRRMGNSLDDIFK